MEPAGTYISASWLGVCAVGRAALYLLKRADGVVLTPHAATRPMIGTASPRLNPLLSTQATRRQRQRPLKLAYASCVDFMAEIGAADPAARTVAKVTKRGGARMRAAAAAQSRRPTTTARLSACSPRCACRAPRKLPSARRNPAWRRCRTRR